MFTMIKIENVEVLGWEHAIRGMRSPMNSWEKSDSRYYNDPIFDEENPLFIHDNPIFSVGPNDQKLMMTLRNAGTDHRKFMRMLVVYLDITGPLYWWKEFDTYKVGTVADSCSTMHKIHAKEFTLDDFSHEHMNFWSLNILKSTVYRLNGFRNMYLHGGLTYDENDEYVEFKPKDKYIWWQLIQLLPSSYNQKRTVMCNYEVLCNMYKSRKDHRLDEWHTLCDWMETLPYSELITGEPSGWKPEDQGRVLNYILQNDPRRDAMNVAVRIFHPYPNVIDYVAVDYDDDDPKFGTVWYSFDMTKVTVIEALDAIKKAIAKMTENGLALGA